MIYESSDLRLPLAFRVGVTGRRELKSDAIPLLRAAIEAFLAVVRNEIVEFASADIARAVYRSEERGPRPFMLRVVSPLAEGADRLVAEAGLATGAELDIPLPFPRSEYEKDFPNSVPAFRALLAKGHVFALDGLRDDGPAQAESYEAVGRFVVRNSDLLIAIWDGKRERGQGGTGQIVSFALRAGMPVWWIHESGAEPAKLLRSIFDLDVPNRAGAGDDAFAALRNLVGLSIQPPKSPTPERGGLFGWLADDFCRRWKPDAPPLIEFFQEKSLPRSFPWRAYDNLMALAAPTRAPDQPPLEPPSTPAERYWFSLFRSADRASRSYGDRYRSSYVLIALFAVMALTVAALAGELPLAGAVVIVAFEATALFGIALLVFVNQTHRWHERWVSYRLLAELCRKQYALCAIGRTLPGADILRLTYDAEAEEASLAPREGWVAWYFTAALRAGAFPQGDG